MSRNRFQMLLRFLHFANNETQNEDRLFKIRFVLKHFNDCMRDHYYPGRDLSIDESMVLWRGRLRFKQQAYIKNKRHKYGTKLYELCEFSGIVLKLQVYCGTSVPDEHFLGQSGATVVDLLDGFFDKGHVVFTDNYYNSVGLAKYLTERSTNGKTSATS